MSFFVESDMPTCRVCGCWQYAACWDDERGSCHWVADDLCSHCADGVAGTVTTTLGTMRARDWLGLHDIDFRDALLLERDDSGICLIARQYLVRLTCPGDIRRERDAALQRAAA